MRRSNVIATLAIVCMLVGLALAGQPDDGYSVQYKMKKGETLIYAQTSKTDILQEMMGAEQEMQITVNAKVKVTSEGKNKDGNIETIVVYDSFVADVFNAMVDSTFTDPAGIVGKRIKKIIAVNGDQIKSTELDTFELGLLARGGFSSEREFLPDLPDGMLKVGETIAKSDTDSTHSMGGTTVINSKIEYTLLGMEKQMGYDCLKIQAKGTIQLEGDGTMQGMNLFIEGDGQVQATMFFAPDEGVLVSSEGHNDLEMTVAVTGQQNMTIPITQSATSTLTLQK